MDRYKLLGIINFIELLWFTFIIFTFQYSHKPAGSLYSITKTYAPLLVIVGLACITIYVLYTLRTTHSKKRSFPLLSMLTILPIIWFFFAFFGFFFVSQPLFPISAFLLACAAYYFFNNISRRLAIAIPLATLVIMGVVIFSNFEEDYCTRAGVIADPTGGKYVQATSDDAKLLAWNNVRKGDQIGVAFRAHFRCHNTFHFIDALQKSYFLR